MKLFVCAFMALTIVSSAPRFAHAASNNQQPTVHAALPTVAVATARTFGKPAKVRAALLPSTTLVAPLAQNLGRVASVNLPAAVPTPTRKY